MAGDSCGWQKIVADGEKHWRMAKKHWRMARDTGGWGETLADNEKYSQIATTFLEMNIF
jgi:hypothetical protein